MSYGAFIEGKRKAPQFHGFDCDDISPVLFPFQRDVVKWAVKQGYTVYYDGRFGSTALAGHGPGNHAHVEFPHGGAPAFPSSL